MTLTLEKLHKDLDITQNINIYVRNTNKKYGTNYKATEELDRSIYMLIKLNTLGKLRRHSQQIKFIDSYIKMENEGEYLVDALEVAEGQVKKAQDLIKKDNLKDSYIETLKIAAKFSKDFGISEEVINFLEKNGVRYAKFMVAAGVDEFFKERIAWFEKELAK